MSASLPCRILLEVEKITIKDKKNVVKCCCYYRMRFEKGVKAKVSDKERHIVLSNGKTKRNKYERERKSERHSLVFLLPRRVNVSSKCILFIIVYI